MALTETACAPRAPGLQGDLDDLITECRQLEDGVMHMTDRLAPVLGAAVPKEAKMPQGQIDRAGNSNLSEGIREAIRIIRSSKLALTETRERLDL